MTKPNPTKWEYCYDDSWKDMIVSDAFSHPAKMSRGLLYRILRHAAAEGWVGPGAVIVDPFGGIGSTGILGAYEAYCVLCIELEQKFVDLAKQSFALHAKKWDKLGCPQPVMIQGDSRELCRLLSECDCIVSSPPYAATRFDGTMTREHKFGGFQTEEYGQTPGQLGAMKPGSADAVISSPPYAETLKGDGTQKETAAESHAKRTDKKAGGPLGQSQRTQGYGSKGNLGNLKAGSVDAVVSSPPFGDAQTGGGIVQNGYHNEAQRKGKFDLVGQRSYMPENQGITPGNLANLKPGEMDAVLSSPPYEQALGHSGGKTTSVDALKRLCNQKRGYGKTKGQLENSYGDTFWFAAKQIVQQCHQLLKPGGVAIWVVKAFVRNKKIVDFPGDWRRLCESVGFETVHEHHAMLVKETKHSGLFGSITEKKERKSFFRRLAESKGSPRIDWENVLCMRK